MFAGQIQYTGSSTGNLTSNARYDILNAAPASGSGPVGYILILDDNGDPFSADMSGGQFSIVELYALKKVI